MTYGPLEFFYDKSFVDYKPVSLYLIEVGDVVKFNNGSYATVLASEWYKEYVSLGNWGSWLMEWYDCELKMHKSKKVLTRNSFNFKLYKKYEV